MDSSEEAPRRTTTTGWAARDSSGVLSPYTYTLRKTGTEDVLIKVLFCGVCHTDLFNVKNHFGITRYPAVPGHEVVGEVLEVGSDVTKFSVGDKVGVGYLVGCCRNCRPCTSGEEQYCKKKIYTFSDVYTDGQLTQGGFADSMIVDHKFVVKIPEGMVLEQAAPLLCAGVTVYSPLSHFGLNKSGVRGGILGLGGVGHMGVKIAKAMGHHVTVISSSNKKKVEEMLEFCKEKELSSMIEVIKMDYINTAFQRLENNDVKYRFVVDVAGSNLHHQ